MEFTVELFEYSPEKGGGKGIYITADNASGAEYSYDTAEDIGRIVQSYIENYYPDKTRRDSIKIENIDVRKLPNGGVEIKCKLADGERPDWFKNMLSDKEKTEKEYDPVNSPKHYTSGKVECIDAMIEIFGVEAVKHFCLCNAFKYHWRHELKNGDEDIKKATWYMNKYKELENR